MAKNIPLAEKLRKALLAPLFFMCALPAAPAAAPDPMIYLIQQQYFVMEIPAYQDIQTKTAGTQSRATLNYGPSLRVAIIANEINKPWDPLPAMQKKMEGLRNGAAGLNLKNLNLVRAEPVSFANSSGYTLVLANTPDQPFKRLHTFVAVAGGVSVTLVVECDNEDAREVYEQIVKSIPATIVLNLRFLPSDAADQAEPSWQAARDAIAIQGVMQFEGRRAAMIGKNTYYEGDTITVAHGGADYTFRFSKIGDNPHAVELQWLAP